MASHISFLLLFISSAQLIRSDFVTCDLDLPSAAHEYLPDDCKELTNEEKQLALEEANKFRDWNQALNKYEEDKDPGFVDIPKKQWEIRKTIQRNSSIWACNHATTDSSYYDCLARKRQDMIDMLTNAEVESVV